MPPAMRDRLAGSEATVGGDERRCARRWRAATRPGAHRDRGATTVLRGPGEAGRSWPQAADRGSPAGEGHVAGQRHLVVAGDGSEIGDLDHHEACEPRAIADCEGSQATSSSARTRCRSRARRALIGSPATTPKTYSPRGSIAKCIVCPAIQRTRAPAPGRHIVTRSSPTEPWYASARTSKTGAPARPMVPE
jgi:hypothetical protein